MKTEQERELDEDGKQLLRLLVAQLAHAKPETVRQLLLKGLEAKKKGRARQWCVQTWECKLMDGDGLLMEMQLLADELNYILNNVVIQDNEMHRVFKWLPERVYRMKFDPNYTAEPVPHICKFLWEVHTNWSFVMGYVPGETIKEKISQL